MNYSAESVITVSVSARAKGPYLVDLTSKHYDGYDIKEEYEVVCEHVALDPKVGRVAAKGGALGGESHCI